MLFMKRFFLKFSLNFDSLHTSRQKDDHFSLNFAENAKFTTTEIRMLFDFFAPFPAEFLKIIFLEFFQMQLLLIISDQCFLVSENKLMTFTFSEKRFGWAVSSFLVPFGKY